MFKFRLTALQINRSKTDKVVANWHTSNPPFIVLIANSGLSVIVDLTLDAANLSSMD